MIDFFDSNLVLIQSTLSGLVLALSIQIPIRMGVFSFAGAGSYGIGAYGVAILVLEYELGAFTAIAIMMVASAVIGLVLGLLISHLRGLYLAMATVAFDLTISVFAINGGELTGGSTGLFGVITDFATGQMLVVTVVVVTLVALTERGRVGRRVDTVRDDPELASSMGINVRRYRLVAFVVSGALGALGGGMNVLVRSVVGPLDIGFGLIVLALTMIIVGGARSWKGAVIGAVIFTWLPQILTIIGEWQELVYGVLVAAAAVFLPQGIYGLISQGTRWWQRRRRDRRGSPQETTPSQDTDGATDASASSEGAGDPPRGEPEEPGQHPPRVASSQRTEDKPEVSS